MIREDRFPATKAWGKLPLPNWKFQWTVVNSGERKCFQSWMQNGAQVYCHTQLARWWSCLNGGGGNLRNSLQCWSGWPCPLNFNTGRLNRRGPSVLAVSTCKSVFVSQYLHCAVQTIYLQIATAGGQQLFGRVGGANINYLKQQICVSNTFAQSTKSSIIFDWISSGGESGNWWTISSFLLSIML